MVKRCSVTSAVSAHSHSPFHSVSDPVSAAPVTISHYSWRCYVSTMAKLNIVVTWWRIYRRESWNWEEGRRRNVVISGCGECPVNINGAILIS